MKDVQSAGGKGAALGEMIQAGFPVPEGFVVLTTALENFLKSISLKEPIENMLISLAPENIDSIDNTSAKIHEWIFNAEMPQEIALEIQQSYRALNVPFVAVRSSATAEDSLSASWAGQLETYLNTSEAELLHNIRHCWASLFTPRALAYGLKKKSPFRACH